MIQISPLTVVSVLGNLCHPLLLMLTTPYPSWPDTYTELWVVRVYMSVMMVLAAHYRDSVLPIGWCVSVMSTVFHVYSAWVDVTYVPVYLPWLWLWIVVSVLEYLFVYASKFALIMISILTPVVAVTAAVTQGERLATLSCPSAPGFEEWLPPSTPSSLSCLLVLPKVWWINARRWLSLEHATLEAVLLHTVYEGVFALIVGMSALCSVDDHQYQRVKRQQQQQQQQREQRMGEGDDVDDSEWDMVDSVEAKQAAAAAVKTITKKPPQPSSSQSKKKKKAKFVVCAKLNQRHVLFMQHLVDLIDAGDVAHVTTLLEKICAFEYDIMPFCRCDCDQCKQESTVLAQIRKDRTTFLRELLACVDDLSSSASSSAASSRHSTLETNNNSTRTSSARSTGSKNNSNRLKTLRMSRNTLTKLASNVKKADSLWEIMGWLDGIIESGAPEDAMRAAADKRRFRIDPVDDVESESDWTEGDD